MRWKCTERDSNDNPIQNQESSYYRVFNLVGEGVAGDFSVSAVHIGVESASSPGGGAQPATVRLHTLEGPFLVAGLTEIAAADIDVPEQALSSLDVPMSADVPAGSILVVELFIPQSSARDLFFIGSNNLGQSAPDFMRAPAAGCNLLEPADIATVASDVHIVLSVSGSRR